MPLPVGVINEIEIKRASDTPGTIGRHFVRQVLEDAVNDLKETPDVMEPPPERDTDHDRKGVPGSPDLAKLIFDKIEQSAVFVADVTKSRGSLGGRGAACGGKCDSAAGDDSGGPNFPIATRSVIVVAPR